MISDKIHSDFFTNLTIIEQWAILEVFSDIQDADELERLSEYISLSHETLLKLQNKVKKHINNFEGLMDDGRLF